MEAQDPTEYPDYRDAWNFLLADFEEMFARPQETAPRSLLNLVRTLATSDWAMKFRPGTSMATLVISTAPYYGLKYEDAFVTVDMHRSENGLDGKLEVRYLKPNRAEQQDWLCAEEDVLSTLKIALAQLWADTKDP